MHKVVRTLLVTFMLLGCVTAPSKSISQTSPQEAQKELERINQQIDAKKRAQAEDLKRGQENRELLFTLQQQGMNARESSRGIVINLPDVLFAFGKAELTQSANGTIKSIAHTLQTVMGRNIAVEGHTDSAGTINFNYELSEARAKEVANALIKNGIDKKLLKIKAFGESEPLSTNRTPEGRTQNRRVEVIIENLGSFSN